MPQSGLHLDRSPDGVWPTRWAWLASPPLDGVTNMAIDAALLDIVAEGDGTAVWRCYAWAQPTVSFGRNERTAGRFSDQSVRAAGLSAVRRPTGGRALLHAREVTYSVTMPLDPRAPWQAGYAAVNAVLLRALHRLGVPAQLVAPHQTHAVTPDGPLCFDQPAAGEIVVDGRKLVGSAVWRQGGAYLQHGSILLADDQPRLATAALCPMPLPPPAATLAACAPQQAEGPLVVDALSAALTETVGLVADGVVAPFSPDGDFASRVVDHCRRFADPAWLWRR